MHRTLGTYGSRDLPGLQTGLSKPDHRPGCTLPPASLHTHHSSTCVMFIRTRTPARHVLGLCHSHTRCVCACTLARTSSRWLIHSHCSERSWQKLALSGLSCLQTPMQTASEGSVHRQLWLATASTVRNTQMNSAAAFAISWREAQNRDSSCPGPNCPTCSVSNSSYVRAIEVDIWPLWL